MTPTWRPGRKAQAFEWYLRQTMRYGVGGGGLGWEVLVDMLAHPIALVVFGMLASATDAFAFTRSIIRTTRDKHDEQ